MAHAPSAPKGFSINEGHTDRLVRVALGLLILALGFAFGSWWGLLGLIPLATGAVGFCPLYAVLGVDTCTFGR